MGPERTSGWSGRRGTALIPALMAVSLIAMLGLSMLSAGLTGSRTVNFQSDEHRLTSAVESVGILAAENLWSGYLATEGGAAGSIQSFRDWLGNQGVASTPGTGAPGAAEGFDLLGLTGLPGVSEGNPEFDNVNIDAVRLVRRDSGDSTQLYITVSASTNRGSGIVNPVLNRAIQLVYTIEPSAFEGFEYGLLANNVNCVFCHANVDSAERWHNSNPDRYGTFERIKVGTLESLMIRHEMDSRPDQISDWDADSFLAGTLYVRGHLVDQHGSPISNFGDATFQSYLFDSDGRIVENLSGDMTPTGFDPAGTPPQPGENLYLDYPTSYSDMPDGGLPTTFPPPFPDDGGIDPVTGAPTAAGADNRVVDPNEFYAASLDAEGAIIAGIINVSDPSFVIDTASEYSQALFAGNARGLQSGVTGNVILSGTQENPIVIDGEVAIDGDVVINGWLKGQGSLIVSGNIYVPTDLQYLDGTRNGERTFGIAADGTKNALGLAAGGNILLGDYLKPAAQDDTGYAVPDQYAYISGSLGTDGSNGTDAWSFGLAEMSLFNRQEWAKTQPQLPGPGGSMVANPFYEGGSYVPRYYQFGPGDLIPIYNGGGVYFDPSTQTWIGDEEVPLSWDLDLLTVADPSNSSDPILYDAVTGAPKAAIARATTKNGWLTEWMQKLAIEYFESNRQPGTPMAIDGLLYTNNAIFGIVTRYERVGGSVVTNMRGQLVVNGSLICADLGLLTPGYHNPGGTGTASNPPGSPYATGLQLNYDRRLKSMLNVRNPMQVTIKRTLWNPTANML